jgi:hypothetical protein
MYITKLKKHCLSVNLNNLFDITKVSFVILQSKFKFKMYCIPIRQICLSKIKLVKLLNDINVVHIIAMTLQTIIMGLMKYGMTFF